MKNSPNVVRYKEDFMYENKHFIVMEFMAGGDLQQRMEKQNFEPLDVSLAKDIAF